jgi:hypothetical protein
MRLSRDFPILPDFSSETKAEFGPLPADGTAAWKRHPGFAISLVVHGLAAFFLIFQMNTAPASLPVVPIEVVQLADEIPPSPAAKNAAREPLSRAAARERQASLTPPRATQTQTIERPAIPNRPADTPAPEQIPRDELETKLQGLAQLRQPQTDPRLLNGAGSFADTVDGNGAARGRGAGYSVMDYIRAQVERRWNLNTTELGARNIVIPIHVVLAADGSVTKAEIVDQKRTITDAEYRSLALAARNAVILSSPFALPSGQNGIMDMTLDLNPRDTLQ